MSQPPAPPSTPPISRGGYYQRAHRARVKEAKAEQKRGEVARRRFAALRGVSHLQYYEMYDAVGCAVVEMLTGTR